jgi:hypothetical protein
MAVTAEFSTEYNKMTDPRTYGRLDPEDTPQKIKAHRFNFTQGAAAGDATSTQTLIYLQPGRYLILWQLSRIEWSAFGASRVLDIGISAYTGEDGTAVAVAANVADDNIDVSAAGTAAMGSDVLAAAIGGVSELKVGAGGASIFATVAGGTIPVAATLKGYVMVAEVGP